jgi:hypothetical protein
MRKLLVAVLAASLPLAIPSPTFAARPPATWDGLILVNSKRIGVVYLSPGADFRGYTKVVIDTPEIAFEKNWQKDYNRSKVNRVRESDMRRAIDGGSKEFAQILARAHTQAGYQVVQQAGPGVLRISTAVINIKVTAPDIMAAGRSTTWAADAGEATLVVEVRDSVSGDLMGRALDRKIVGDNNFMMRANSVTNRSDFEILFKRWATVSAEGLRKLQALSPINANGQTQR